MGVLTDIKPQTRNKGRVSLYVDGKFFCGLEKLTAAAYRLHIGDEIDGDKLAAAVYESECGAAFERAAKYLGARPRTQSEITSYLVEKGYAENAVRATVKKLSDYGYIDDADYCRVYVQTYRHKSGARKLEAELRAKGIARELIEEALGELDDQTDEAATLAQKYMASHKYDRRKAYAYLLSKGFDYDTAKSALEQCELPADDDE